MLDGMFQQITLSTTFVIQFLEQLLYDDIDYGIHYREKGKLRRNTKNTQLGGGFSYSIN